MANLTDTTLNSEIGPDTLPMYEPYKNGEDNIQHSSSQPSEPPEWFSDFTTNDTEASQHAKTTDTPEPIPTFDGTFDNRATRKALLLTTYEQEGIAVTAAEGLRRMSAATKRDLHHSWLRHRQLDSVRRFHEHKSARKQDFALKDKYVDRPRTRLSEVVSASDDDTETPAAERPASPALSDSSVYSRATKYPSGPNRVLWRHAGNFGRPARQAVPGSHQSSLEYLDLVQSRDEGDHGEGMTGGATTPMPEVARGEWLPDRRLPLERPERKGRTPRQLHEDLTYHRLDLLSEIVSKERGLRTSVIPQGEELSAYLVLAIEEKAEVTKQLSRDRKRLERAEQKQDRLRKEINEMQETLKMMYSHKKKSDEERKNHLETIDVYKRLCSQTTNDIRKLRENQARLESVLKEKDEIIARLEQIHADRDAEATEDAETELLLEKKSKALEEKEQTLDEAIHMLHEKDEALSEKDRVLEQKDTELQEGKRSIQFYAQDLEDRDKTIEEQRARMKEMEGQVKSLQRTVTRFEIAERARDLRRPQSPTLIIEELEKKNKVLRHETAKMEVLYKAEEWDVKRKTAQIAKLETAKLTQEKDNQKLRDRNVDLLKRLQESGNFPTQAAVEDCAAIEAEKQRSARARNVLVKQNEALALQMAEDVRRHQAQVEQLAAENARLRKQVDEMRAAQMVARHKHGVMVRYHADMEPEPALLAKAEWQRQLRQEAIERERQMRRVLLEKHEQFYRYLHEFVDDRSKIIEKECPFVFEEAAL